jgi:hypothetical protein
MQNAKFKMQNSKCKMQNAECNALMSARFAVCILTFAF